MEGFVKAATAALITAVLCLMLSKQGKDTAILLTVLACAMILTVAMGYLRTVTDFISTLEALIALEGDHFQVLLKIADIGMLSETASLICSDAGNAGLGKALQILGTVLILCLSIPLLHQLLDLIREILEGV
jgi:stage III sporulation protein AD